ncbi:nitrite reductase small subunit NirD [Arcticibacterium luteifluviistationis]|uniref:Nitrite reductase (NAD(P)H) small subunit n=1 Tax=Arcticibacterium luteifluviistationis TaxID=1784714 RepID=A0A2Z4GE01_9BACT|nr:nitrite reductase small subunit NirD [Arcticibacterium luteifluviistationis]AWV99539.1 nitrite reductase (NAD(P)H) small subunit [Arcticibacterium luteifluviistationis]
METVLETKAWVRACKVEDIPANGGACVMIDGEQIAIFNFERRGEWYATQNLCPHKQQMVLSRGMIGATKDEPKVACPFHKKNFSLKTGACMGEEDYQLKTYEIKVEGSDVFVGL